MGIRAFTTFSAIWMVRRAVTFFPLRQISASFSPSFCLMQTAGIWLYRYSLSGVGPPHTVPTML